MIPVYGFLEGDTMGLLLLADEAETIASLTDKMEASAATRVAPRGRMNLAWRGRIIEPHLTVAEVGIAPLDRVDVSPRGDGAAT
jgi:hypothetical protein